ncbi:MAG TPA: DUF4349 domain-containing protein [Pirellulaceae bacterium]|nr:DUF4349 domain-containing protein [Pirellulaceae bacterium]
MSFRLRRNRCALALALLAVTTGGGCGEAAPRHYVDGAPASDAGNIPVSNGEPQSGGDSANSDSSTSDSLTSDQGGGEASNGKIKPEAETGKGPASSKGSAGATSARATRKIIYEAKLTLVVESLKTFEERLPQLIERNDGFIGEATVDRTQGRWLSGTWIVRIPVDRYDVFLKDVAELGNVVRLNQTSQDVSAEFVDVEARIANGRKLEQRILELLQRQGGEIKDVIVVEQELARVRGEIERAEGRKRFLENRTSLTTVTLRAEQRENYTPPKEPTFLGRVADVWNGSIHAIVVVAQGLMLGVVFFAPWLAILIGLIVAIRVVFRRK